MAPNNEKLNLEENVSNSKEALLDETSSSAPGKVMNWAETVTVESEKFRFPENVEEIQELIRTHDKIRCAGALHSCAPLIASDDIIMSLTKLDKILEIDPVAKTARVQSGVPIHNLCEALVPYGLAVGTLGTIDWQTISGAVMTGTHGGALTVPSLHDFVTSYTLVKPNTEIITVSKEEDPHLFSAMAPSMGVFGTVVELTIKCVPLQMLEAKFETVSFDTLVNDTTFADTMEKNKYARVVIYPSINKATLWTANPIDPSDIPAMIANGAYDSTKDYMNFRNSKEKELLEKYLKLCDEENFDAADETLLEVLASQKSRLGHYIGRYNHVLCKERNNGIPHADIEFNFDYRDHLKVLSTVQEYCNNNRVPYYNFEIRTTKQDNAMMSCCSDRDAMWIDFQAKADVSKEFFGAMEKVLRPIGFRKHWAKGLENTDPAYVVNQFSRIDEFVALMKEFDPAGKFRNRQGEEWYQSITQLLKEQKNGSEPTYGENLKDSNVLDTEHTLPLSLDYTIH